VYFAPSGDSWSTTAPSWFSLYLRCDQGPLGIVIGLLDQLLFLDLRNRNHLSLGARGHLPRGYIEDTLRFFKQFVHTLSRGYMLVTFAMYPPL